MMSMSRTSVCVDDLPGLDCGVCGSRSCKEFAQRVAANPALLSRCIHLSRDTLGAEAAPGVEPVPPAACGGCRTCVSCDGAANEDFTAPTWHDSLNREFDFYLEHFPEDPGPREIILPHNPLITRELDIRPGDILVGRPLGMSCGCPITHCGVAMEVDQRTGVMDWCVTGPLTPREQGFKDMGYYIAEGYEGLITQSRVEPRIGMRYYFQPRMCMLQWRHSGLVNYLNRTEEGLQVRLEGLWIG